MVRAHSAAVVNEEGLATKWVTPASARSRAAAGSLVTHTGRAATICGAGREPLAAVMAG